MPTVGSATITSADIARLAGVGRAAVSNWRRRFADFPTPVGGTAASPLYRLADVEGWLRTHGRTAEVPPLERVWQDLRSRVDDLRLAEGVGLVGGVLVLASRAPQAWAQLDAAPDNEFPYALCAALSSYVPELPDVAPDAIDPALIATLRAAVPVVGNDAAAAVQFLVGRFHEATARRAPTVPAGLAGLVVELAAVAGRAVLDPASGTGDLLDAARSRGAAGLAGQDSDLATCRIAAARLLAQGATVEMAVGDSLRADGFPGRLFGAVVCEPPFGERAWGHDELGTDLRWQHGLPPRGEPELAWVQHCLSHAEPGGRVVVVMPAAAADRRSGRRIRRNLVRSGALRAVVGFPGEAGRSVDVWVLQRPHPDERPPAHLLFVVAELDDVAQHWQGFVSDTVGDRPGRRAVAPVDLLDDEVDLSPARHVPAHSADGDLATVRGVLENELRALPVVPRFAVRTTELPTTTVGDLVRAGAVEVLQAPGRTAVDVGDVPVLTARDLTASRGPTGRTASDPAMVPLRPGDVVVPMLSGREVVTRVVGESEVGAVLGPRLLCLRVDPARVDPHLLAGCLRASSGSTMRSATSLSRSDIRRVGLPLLPIEEQRRIGAAFTRLVALTEALHRCATAGDAYLQAATSGLVKGRIGPEP